VVEPSSSAERALADPDDQPVLGTLVAALHASHLITGDRAPLALAQPYPVITPAAFWAAQGGV
jgi:predicted nucleic acid-binding protein